MGIHMLLCLSCVCAHKKSIRAVRDLALREQGSTLRTTAAALHLSSS